MLLLDSVRFRAVPRASGVSVYFGAPDAETQRSKAAPRGNMRIVGAFRLFISRGIPVCPYMSGCRIRIPEVQTRYFQRIFGVYRRLCFLASVSFSGRPGYSAYFPGSLLFRELVRIARPNTLFV